MGRKDAVSGHIKRPLNAFMAWSQAERRKLSESGSVLSNSAMSRVLGERWNSLTNEEQKPWRQMAERLKREHAAKYPAYKYQPRRKNSQQNNKSPNSKQQLNNRAVLTEISPKGQGEYSWPTQFGEGSPPESPEYTTDEDNGGACTNLPAPWQQPASLYLLPNLKADNSITARVTVSGTSSNGLPKLKLITTKSSKSCSSTQPTSGSTAGQSVKSEPPQTTDREAADAKKQEEDEMVVPSGEFIGDMERTYEVMERLACKPADEEAIKRSTEFMRRLDSWGEDAGHEPSFGGFYNLEKEGRGFLAQLESRLGVPAGWQDSELFAELDGMCKSEMVFMQSWLPKCSLRVRVDPYRSLLRNLNKKDPEFNIVW